MLTDSQLKSSVDALWNKVWTGGLSNPLDAIEQLSYLLFLKQIDEREQDGERQAKRRGGKFVPLFPDPTLRWSHWSQLPADKALKHVKDVVFPFLKNLGDKAGSFGAQMENAEFKINKPALLIEICRAIEAMQISAQNQDVQGDLYEYLLSKLNTAGTNGQFRTPRHIIRMMVKMLDPRPGERVCDPAAGTCGFLVNAWQHLLETHTDPRDLTFDEEGWPHGLTGSGLKREEYEFAQKEAFTGYDSDSGMTMLRIGSMNLMLHGLASPRFHYTDTLSKGFNEERTYDVVLANPPFKGAIDTADVNPSLPAKVKKTEILFVHLFLRLLENGGRAAVIVPDGVLFGSSNAHVEVRKLLIEGNRLDGVVSMPSGVFRPYAGVSSAVLLFTKGAATERIWYYDMEHDGFSLDDKRQRVAENDIADLLDCWQQRHDPKFQKQRDARLAKLQKQIAPLKQDRLAHHAIIHRLKFEEVVAKEADAARGAREQAEAELAELQARITPLENEINQLTRQFWVTKEQVAANKYDLSASRYRQVEHEEVFYENTAVTLEQMRQLERAAERDVSELGKLLSAK
ncbi:MAG: N-6 DNA methylase [Propionivibrio sp.]|uniref:type I restriction-modification system subunit M n=1 Tax=Propionivibrio sp. TaxID=2212460 RepID=UPI0025E49635|nr:N-6 DNA methylase [Propionivibrio sp.]MBK8893326.1 N-6 DNA methylase [Propionivibrio sp.]